MAKQALGLGTIANDNTGDTLRAGGDKINDNFSELYSALGNGTTLTVNVTNPAAGQVLRYNGSTFLPSDYTNLTAALDVNGNSIISSSNGNINIAPNGTGNLTLGGASTSGGSATFSKGNKVTITSAGDDSARTFTITGTNDSGQSQNEQITGANAGTAEGTKLFKTITQISVDGATTGNVTAGTFLMESAKLFTFTFSGEPFNKIFIVVKNSGMVL